ncbi:MAG: glutamine synthetase type III [Clostridiales bacterium]|nr:glutamine synthetase type III [Clostridiales bacterium]
MMKPQEIFGSRVFNFDVMRSRLPRETYMALQQAMATGKRLPPEVAAIVANAMKDWAIEHGCTHYSHWFQPLSGVTAEKHDSFITPVDHGRLIMEFGPQQLIRGESDASSFPSGGLRATFEARGYTAWDPTSYPFIKDYTLCIPTAFCSYDGQALDKKTPLLRSMDALNRQALRILRLFGNFDVQRITACVGAEQEYFLVDKAVHDQRRDLRFTGRTLYGARPPKGQELSDHYYGTIPRRVQDFMKELNEELWMLGIPAKTEHNETAPGQHELAPIYETVNIAADHNQMIMEVLKRTAHKHGMVCLLHEKPFEGINGSGKHNNWSLSTDQGVNLLEPGATPQENAQFLLFLTAILKAVDEHQELLRLSVASAGNDCRLGAFEAPPSILSIFLGDELTEVLDALVNHRTYVRETTADMSIGVHVLPKIPRDISDRNRTSPFAFTGNKFEFRSVGSAMSIAEANITINTTVADALMQFADELEKAEDFQAACEKLIISTITQHRRIIFNGNSYAEEWRKEAKKRGLLELKTVADCLPLMASEKNIVLFGRQQVLSETEIKSRVEVLSEQYCQVLRVEAQTMLDMARQEILPAIAAYAGELGQAAAYKTQLLPEGESAAELPLLQLLNRQMANAAQEADKLEQVLGTLEKSHNWMTLALKCKQALIPQMRALRDACDAAELHVAKKHWPFPTYGELINSI